MHSSIFIRADIDTSVKMVLKKVDVFCKDITSIHDKIHQLRETFTSEIEKKIFDIFYTHIVNSERSSPGSCRIFLDFLLDKQKDVKNARLLRRKDLREIISPILEKDSNLVFEILNLLDFKTKVIIKDEVSRNSETIIEKSNSFYFENLYPEFLLQKNKILDARICTIDGFIESVSEIHHLLEKASSLNEPVVLFVRGLSDDVRHTLKLNYNRGTVTCVPVVVNFDLEGANLLNDIAIISGCDVISSFRGDLINSINLESLSRIESISFLPSGISIQNRSSLNRIEHHVSFLKKKIEESDLEITRENLTKRLQRFTVDQVTVTLSKDHKKIRSKIDQSLRSIQFAKNFGIIDYGDKIIPISSYESGAFFYQKFKKTIEEIGCIVV